MTDQPATPPRPSIRGGWTLHALDQLARAVVSNNRTWWPAGDRVIIRDRSLNCGALDGRAAILLGTRDDEDGYDYRVRITETHGLVTIGGTYETWVQGVVFPEAAKAGERS